MKHKIDQIKRILYYVIAMTIRPLIPVKKNRIIMWSYTFRKYTCHPLHFTNYLLDNHPDEFEIVWVFERPENFKLNARVKVVKYFSIKYLYYLYSSRFVISNSRSKKFYNFYKRKSNQDYILMWHDSGVALKKIEKDVSDTLGSYIKDAINDSKNCTLMLSACKFQTELIKRSFWYNGDIMEKGLPRNDCFVNSNMKLIRKKVCEYYNIPEDSRILLYAPTFRNNHESENIVFIKEWDSITKLAGVDYVFVRLHPNSIGVVDINSMTAFNEVIDTTYYNDMQELLMCADLLITDYSSCMIDMALLRKPCLLYTVDIDSYDRGYYFDLNELPFSISKNMRSLIKSLQDYNENQYLTRVDKFLSDEGVGFFDIGESCISLYNWMKDHEV